MLDRAQKHRVHANQAVAVRAFDEHQPAAPGSLQGSRNALCGRRVEVCKNGSCVTATIVERSVESSSSTWEGSPHLIRAMGGEGGFTSCTHSWGTVSGVSLRY